MPSCGVKVRRPRLRGRDDFMLTPLEEEALSAASLSPPLSPSCPGFTLPLKPGIDFILIGENPGTF